MVIVTLIAALLPLTVMPHIFVTNTVQIAGFDPGNLWKLLCFFAGFLELFFLSSTPSASASCSGSELLILFF
jgi:hypothetical protein